MGVGPFTVTGESDMSRVKDPDRSKSINRHSQLLSRTIQSLDESRRLRLPRSGYVLRIMAVVTAHCINRERLIAFFAPPRDAPPRANRPRGERMRLNRRVSAEAPSISPHQGHRSIGRIGG
jgi:hypothetical protein